VEIVPLEVPPRTLQVTAVFGVPVTLASNCWLLPAVTVVEVGEMLTKIWTGGVELPDPPQPPRMNSRKQDEANEKEKGRNIETSPVFHLLSNSISSTY
jgi:hypothetical protein